MGLKALTPMLGALPPAVAWLPAKTVAEIDRDRGERNQGRRWYHTAAWRRLRWQVLTEALFTCARCGVAHGNNTSRLHCDHIKPHKGNHASFWARSNLQCLCDICHNGAKQLEELRALR